MDAQDFAARRRQYAGRPLRASDVAPDPFDQFHLWFEEIVAAGGAEPEAVALATDDDGQPSVRFVLLRGVDARGFVFYSNRTSRKGRELDANPRAALAWHWPELERQVRVVGAVQIVDPGEADAYFATRPLGSRLGAWASPQSAVIADRAALDARLDAVRERFGLGDGDAEAEIPRPEFWVGWRVIPDEVEFWQGRADRLHDRIRYRRDGNGWLRERLAP